MKYLSILIPIAILVVIALWMGSAYNGFVNANENVDGQWAEVETSYQRRFDLIPNLVKTVKGYADFEKSTLVEVTQARASAMKAMNGVGQDGKGLQEFERANQGLGVAMGRFFGYTERYPELKANQNFLELQAQLEGTENRIAVARDRYNEAVKVYNKKIKTFPGTMFAGLFGFQEREYFESKAGAEDAPQVDFGSNE